MLKNVRHTLAAATLIGGLAGLSGQAMACGAEPYVSEICYFAFSYCPKGYAEANGAVLPITQNQALYALIGSYYGGDGRTNFALPDARGRVLVDQNPTGASNGVKIAYAGKLGAPTLTLTTANLPAGVLGALTGITYQATTTIGAAGASGSSGPGAGVIIGQPAYAASTAATPGTLGGVTTTVMSSGTATVAFKGAGQAISTQQPTQALIGCIATSGLYPVHP